MWQKVSLTDQEKQLVVKELPACWRKQDDTYYLIYRPTRQLPATGHSQLISSIAAGAGIVLLIRADRKTCLSQALISPGSQLRPILLLALTNAGDYNQECTGRGNIATLLLIEGYQYVGHLKSQKK